MKRLFKKKIYLKLFINVTLSVVFGILLTSIVLYANFKSTIMNYEYQAKTEQLNNKQAQVAKLSEVAVNIGNQIYHDMYVSKLLYYENPNVFDMSAAFNQLRTYRLTIPYIESIYVYNKFNDSIYVDAGNQYSELTENGYPRQSDGFADSSASEIIANFKDYKPFCPIGRIYKNKKDGKETSYFYTFFMYDAYTKDNNTSGVLINFKTDYFLDNGSEQSDYDSEYFILDQDGTVVSNTSDLKMLKNYSDTSYVKKIVKNHEKQGYFTDVINGEKLFFVYTAADKYGWQYVSITKYSQLLSSVNWMQMLTIFLNVIFVMVGIFTAFFATRWIYNPINEMEADIKELQDEKRSAKRVLKKVYVNDLLSGKEGYDHENLFQSFANINMKIDFTKNLVVILIKLDDYKNVIECNDSEMIQTLKFAIINVYDEVLGEEFTVNGTDMGESDILLFVNISAESDLEHFLERIQHAKKVVNDYFNISFTLMISSMDKRADQLKVLYHQITEASMHRILYDKGSIIFADQLNKKLASEYEYPVSKEKQLVEALMTGKIKESEEIYQIIISNLRDYPISIYNMVISRLVVTLNNAVGLLKKNSMNSAFETGELILLLQSPESAEDVTKQFYDFFNRIGAELEKKKSNKHGLLIEQIKELINQRYFDPDFSIVDIADAVDKSVPYISRIYSQFTGTTIKDTISELRMIKAKQLLEERKLSINEIAIEVGFRSASYFHKTFKKLNGVTPKEFREKAKER